MRLYNTRIDAEQLERMHESMEGYTLVDKLEYQKLVRLADGCGECSGYGCGECSGYVRVRAYGDAPD